MLLFSLIDPALGKVDKSCLPHQTLMELLVANIADTKIIFQGKKSPDISEWLINRNDDGEVTEINWYGYRLGGSIALEWLPPTVEVVWFPQNNFEGTLHFDSLPEALRSIDISMNALTGSLNLTALPPRMEFLNVSHNRLTGTIDVTCLPKTLKSLYLQQNPLVGSTDFSKLPKVLEVLTVSNTQLSGVIVRQNADQRFFIDGSSVTVSD